MTAAKRLLFAKAEPSKDLSAETAEFNILLSYRIALSPEHGIQTVSRLIYSMFLSLMHEGLHYRKDIAVLMVLIGIGIVAADDIIIRAHLNDAVQHILSSVVSVQHNIVLFAAFRALALKREQILVLDQKRQHADAFVVIGQGSVFLKILFEPKRLVW